MIKILTIILIPLIPLILLIYLLKTRIIGLLKIITKLFEFSDYYFSYKLFSRVINNKPKNKKKILSLNNFAIIIQGPIIPNSNFTLETLKYYSAQYPKSPVIFSSWEDDINKIKNYSLKKNIHLISNKLPSYPGVRNINLQVVSTKNAILYAKKLKCNYVFKTRSDTRVYFKDFQNYLINLIKFYKLKKNFKSKQMARIVSTNFTRRYRLYGISDLIMFGHIKDLYNYFDALATPLIKKEFNKLNKKLKFKDKLYFIDREFCPEIYFFYNYFKKKNVKLKWSVDDYLKKISENFIIIDNQTLDIYWKKSNKTTHHFSDRPISLNYSLDFNFTDWLEYFYKSNKIKKL